MFVITALIATLAYSVIMGYNTPSCITTSTATLKNFKPGVFEKEPGVYVVNIIAQRFYFSPSQILLHNPKKIIFNITSSDVIHGLRIIGTNVNMMIIPGYFTEVTWYPPSNFEGTYLIICTEYCRTYHSTMYATIIIEK